MQVKDIMTREVISASPDNTIKEVAQMLTKNKIHALPVVDHNKVVGIIAEEDLFVKDLSLHLPSYIEFIRQNKPSGGRFRKESTDKIRQLLDARAKDVMTSECKTVVDKMSLEELFGYIKATGYVTFPVVDEKDELVGVVTLSDVISLL